MSRVTKTCIRIYTIADYDKEEIWLREMAKQGWMLEKVFICIYTFVQCEPQDMVFKLEFRETPLEADQEYMNMLGDFGWKYVTSCNNFRYFCKSAEEDERNNELFTDNESKLKMLRTIELRRLLPVTIIFLCCVIPNSVRVITEGESVGFTLFWLIMLVLYILMIIRIAAGFRRLRNKYEQE